MLVIMNRYNQTGKMNAFLSALNCAGMIVCSMLVNASEDVAYCRQIQQWSDSCD